MTKHSVLYIPSLFKRHHDAKHDENPRPTLDLDKGWWKTPLLFMLMLTLTGLDLVPALLIALIIIMNQYRRDKYNAVIMIMILCANFALFDNNNVKIWMSDIALLVSVALWALFKRTPFLNRTMLILIAYAVMLVFISTFSIESLTVQIYTIRNCLAISFIIIPIVIFRNEKFDIYLFFKRLMPYILLMSIFYIIDAFILCGNVLVPRTHAGYEASTLFDLYWAPGSFSWYRKYPQGMFIVSMMLFGATRVYKLKWWHWIVILLGIISTQTATFIFAFLMVYFFLAVKPAKIFKYALLVIVGFVAIYFVDAMLPVPNQFDESNDSRLRIKSTVDQIFSLAEAVDDEDLARFASGRFAQAIPKLELVEKEGRQLTGLGFLHPEKSKIKQYIIINEYYTDISNNEEVATGVEIVPVEAYLSAGWLGVIAVTLLFFGLYMMVRRMRYGTYFLSVICFDFLAGLGGFLGFKNIEGLIMIATAYAVVYMAQKRIDEDEEAARRTALNVRN